MTEAADAAARDGSGRRSDEPPAARSTMADDVLDELLPDDLDWRDLVRRYPIPSVTVVALAGFLLGRSRGREMVGALAGFAADTLSEGVNEYLGKDVL